MPDNTVRLPLQPSPLIGRDDERAAVCARLAQPDVRLLTLTGPPGVGKTRLAVAVAEQLASRFALTAFVDLTPLADPALVVQAIAGHLDLQETPPGSVATQIGAAIGDRDVLFVLDNFEHVLAGAPVLAGLLSQCPGLRVLATSRAPLALRWERRVPVAPLTPAAALTLFVDRAQAVAPSFALTPDTAPLVARICARLDGLPLAIEVAAARAAVLPLPALAERLEQSLDLLGDGPRDLPPRHRTLRDAIAWSYQLLAEPQQRLLHRLAVFAGGCDEAAVRAVYGAEPDSGGEVAGGLDALVIANLLRQETDTDGRARFRLLETTRAYARERLETSDEAPDAQHRHALYFLALAGEAEPHIKTGRREPWLRRLDQDLDNIRAALRWCVADPSRVALGLRLAATLDMYWHFRDHWREARDWLERLLAAAGPDLDDATRARALCVAGRLDVFLRDQPPAAARLQESLALAEQVGDAECRAYVLTWLARLAQSQADTERARDCAAEAIACFRAIDHPWGLALACWYHAGPAANLGDHDGALASLDEGLRTFRSLDDEWGMGLVYETLMIVLRQRGDIAAARRAGEAALAIRRRTGVRFAIASSLRQLARTHRAGGNVQAAAVAYDEAAALYRELKLWPELSNTLRDHALLDLRHGDAAAALPRLQESLRLLKDSSDRTALGLTLGGIAGAAAAIGETAIAAHLAAAARALTGQAGFGNLPGQREDFERIMREIAATSHAPAAHPDLPLSDLALAQSIELALTLSTPAHPSPATPVDSNRHIPLPDGLTRREAEVIALIAAGRSNREIAETLVLSLRTVEKHIANIYGKIEARGRANATAYVIRHSLARLD